MRLLVCGGRDFDNRDLLRWQMNLAVGEHKNVTVIHGGARGADRLAGAIAEAAGIPVVVFRAYWDRYGKRAGFIRNKQMLDEGKPDLVLAAPGGAGTKMMVEIALSAGVPVITF